MIPAVPFRHPDDLAGLIEIVAELFVSVINERRLLIVDDCSRAAGVGIDPDDSQHLMTALVEDEPELPRVRLPAEVGDAPRIREQVVGDRNLLSLGHIKQVRLRDRKAVPRLQVLKRLQLRLKLIARRRLDKLHLPIVSRLSPHHDDAATVGRPERRSRIRIAELSFLAERHFVAALAIAQHDIVLFHEDRPFPIGRIGIRVAVRRSGALIRFRQANAIHDRTTSGLGRFKDSQRLPLRTCHQPHVTGERVLFVLLIRLERRIRLAASVGIEPENLNRFLRPIDEPQRRLFARPSRRTRLIEHRQRFGHRVSGAKFAQLITRQQTFPPLAADRESQRREQLIKADLIERQSFRRDFFLQRLAKRVRHSRVIESRSPLTSQGIDQYKLASSLPQIIAIPEPLIAVEPTRTHRRFENLVPRQHRQLSRAIVVRSRPLRVRARQRQNRPQENRKPAKLCHRTSSDKLPPSTTERQSATRCLSHVVSIAMTRST